MNEKRRRASALVMKYYSGMIDEGSWKHASGDIAVFSTKYRRNLKSLNVQLEPVQAGSGDPSPDNIRPISGRTGATVTRTGRNLIPFPYTDQRTEIVGVSVTVNSDGTILFNGTPTGGTMFFNITTSANGKIHLPAGTYTISNGGIIGNRARLTVVKDGTYLASTSEVDGVSTFTTTEGDFIFYISTPAGIAMDNILVKPQLEIGSIATAYEPYTGATIPVSWEAEAGTVYGAELDVVSGELTVDRVLWTKNTSTMNNGETFPGWSNSGIRQLIGAGYNYLFTNQLLNVGNAFAANTTSTYDILYLPLPLYKNKTETEWKALAMDIQIAVELATPQTYQLTPQQIQTLIGENVIWSDAGPVSVEYWS